MPWRTIGILLALFALLVVGAVISIGLFSDRSNPAPPFGLAENGLVAYAADGDLYSRDLVTGAEELLVGGPGDDVFPVFSRDGLSLAWFRLSTEQPEFATLMVANADGSESRTLGQPAIYDVASWSPTSDALAVISSVRQGRTLSVVGIDGATTVIDVPVVPETEVQWRPPDGSELIFAAADGMQHAIYGVAPDGTGFRQISQNGTIDSYWSPYEITPDGSQMLFVDGGDPIDIGILNLETGEQRPFGAALPELADSDGGLEHHGGVTILADGETIVFGRYWNQAAGRINHQLYVGSIASDGADAVAIGPVHRSRAAHNPFWQAVSPDGESIVVVENDTHEVWTVRPDGTGREQLDWGELNDPPTWQRLAP